MAATRPGADRLLTALERTRMYEPGDEAGILELFASVFGQARPPERWKWQYAEHPQGQSWISVAESGGELVAHYAVMRAHLNCMGQEIPAGQPCDTLTRGDQRGRGWYRRLASEVYANVKATGGKAIYGFPNRSSFPGFVRSLEGHKITVLKRYYRRTGARKVLGSVADSVLKLFHRLPNRLMLAYSKKRRGSQLRIASSSQLPSGIHSLLKEHLDHQVLSIWKDQKYLHWRYESHPTFRYAFHTLSVDGDPDCLVITRLQDGILTICEAITGSGNVGRMATLLRHVTDDGFRESGTQVVEFYGFDSGFFDAVFGLAGFRIVPHSGFLFAGRVLGDPELDRKFLLPHNWSISYGDTDVI